MSISMPRISPKITSRNGFYGSHALRGNDVPGVRELICNKILSYEKLVQPEADYRIRHESIAGQTYALSARNKYQ
jgi:hypothetical protein